VEATRRPVWYNHLEVQQAIWTTRCCAEGKRKGGLLQPKVPKGPALFLNGKTSC
jgi:hypothetical protein